MNNNLETIVLGGGCFWCLDAGYRLIEGVTEVISGYSGGFLINPSYYEVSSQTTGHAEVVKITFNSTIISLEDILDIFWAMHDPTTLNRQGDDSGTQYRSAIFYSDDAQKKAVEDSVATVAKLWNNPVVTEVTKLESFYPAEEEHQNYFEKHPEQAYCQVIINPKLKKLRQKFQARLKNDL